MWDRILATRIERLAESKYHNSCDRCGHIADCPRRAGTVHCADCVDLMKLERYYESKGVTLFDFTEEELDEMTTSDRNRRRTIIRAVIRRVQARQIAAGLLTEEELEESGEKLRPKNKSRAKKKPEPLAA